MNSAGRVGGGAVGPDAQDQRRAVQENRPADQHEQRRIARRRPRLAHRVGEDLQMPIAAQGKADEVEPLARQFVRKIVAAPFDAPAGRPEERLDHGDAET